MVRKRKGRQPLKIRIFYRLRCNHFTASDATIRRPGRTPAHRAAIVAALTLTALGAASRRRRAGTPQPPPANPVPSLSWTFRPSEESVGNPLNHIESQRGTSIMHLSQLIHTAQAGLFEVRSEGAACVPFGSVRASRLARSFARLPEPERDRNRINLDASATMRPRSPNDAARGDGPGTRGLGTRR